MKDFELILDKIVEAANQNNEISEFGREIAEILLEHDLIEQAVYDILVGN